MGLFGSKTTGGDVRMRTNLFDFFLPGVDSAAKSAIQGSTGSAVDPLVSQARESIAGLPAFIKQRSAELRKQLTGAASAGAQSAIIAAGQAARRTRGSRGAVADVAARSAAMSSSGRTAGIAQALAQATGQELGSTLQANQLLGGQSRFAHQISAAGMRQEALRAKFGLLNTALGGVGQVTATQLKPGGSLFTEITGGIGQLGRAAGGVLGSIG